MKRILCLLLSAAIITGCSKPDSHGDDVAETAEETVAVEVTEAVTEEVTKEPETAVEPEIKEQLREYLADRAVQLILDLDRDYEGTVGQIRFLPFCRYGLREFAKEMNSEWSLLGIYHPNAGRLDSCYGETASVILITWWDDGQWDEPNERKREIDVIFVKLNDDWLVGNIFDVGGGHDLITQNVKTTVRWSFLHFVACATKVGTVASFYMLFLSYREIGILQFS